MDAAPLTGPNPTSVLDVRGLRARYGPEREILKGIDFTVSADDFLVVIGPSGSGKSTLILSLIHI